MECPKGHGPMRQIIKNVVTGELRLKCLVCGHKETVKEPESEDTCG